VSSSFLDDKLFFMHRNQFGKKIAQLRKLRGMSQRELAKKAGITARSITYYELEEKINFVEKIEKISHALGVSAGELFDYANNEGEASAFDILNPRVVKKLKMLLQLSPSDRTKIYEQIELYLKKDEYNQ